MPTLRRATGELDRLHDALSEGLSALADGRPAILVVLDGTGPHAQAHVVVEAEGADREASLLDAAQRALYALSLYTRTLEHALAARSAATAERAKLS